MYATRSAPDQNWAGHSGERGKDSVEKHSGGPEWKILWVNSAEKHCGATVWSNTVEHNSCESSQRNVLGTYSGRTGNVHFVSLVMELA